MNTTAKTSDLILRYALAFVVIWFGINEIFATSKWLSYVPHFLGTGALAYDLVIFHGIVLCLAGILLALGWQTRIVAAIVALMLLDIVINFLFTSGLNSVAIRDVGLFGAALSLVFARPTNLSI